MRIAIDINDVLRDTYGKAAQIYQKFFIDDYIKEDGEDDFEFKLLMPITSTTLSNHFKFKTDEDLFDFFYVDFAMQIFGHAPSTSANTFNTLNKIYEDLREKHDILIVSEEMRKSKPATLFFLSKYGCLVEKIKFYSNITIKSLWNEVDVIITANPKLMNNKPKKKIIIKYNTRYNKESKCDYVIDNLSDFENLYKELKF